MDRQLRSLIYSWVFLIGYMIPTAQANPIVLTPTNLIDEKDNNFDQRGLWYESEDQAIDATYLLENLHLFQAKTQDIETVADKDYWCYLSLYNTAKRNRTDWVLEFDLGVTHIDAYLMRNSGIVEHYATGYFNTANKSYIPIVKANLIALDIDPEESVQVLLRIRSSRKPMPPILDISIQPLTQYESGLRAYKSRNMAYMGFILMMFVFTVLLFAMQQDQAVIYYAIYLLFVSIFTSYNSGDFAEFFYRNFANYNVRMMYFGKLSVYALLFGYLMFIRMFLNLKEASPRWDNILNWTTYLSVGFCLLDAFLIVWGDFSPDVCDKVTVTYATIFVVITSALLFPIHRLKDNKRHFIFWGVLFMNIGIAFSIYFRLLSQDFSTLPFKIGSILEIVIFSLGIVYRQQERIVEKKNTEFQLKTIQLLQKQEHEKLLQLQELNEFKSNVFSNITHEFKNPLSVILGLSNKLTKYPEEQQSIRRNGEELLNYVDQILELSKADHNQLLLHPISGDVLSFITSVQESHISAASLKNITLHYSKPEGALIMLYDEVALKHIINNLLSNAIKFTPLDGEILLSIHIEDMTDKYQLIIRLEDGGKGVPDQDISKIFGRFYQGTNSQSSGLKGTGIGLALVQELIELMAGDIRVDNSSRYGGAAFEVSIPIVQEVVKKESRELLQKGEASIDVIETDINDLLILVVDDNREIVDYISSILIGSSTVLKAYNGIEAEQLALDQIPDVIITDLMMPGQNGIKLSENVRKDPKLNHVPIIMLSANKERDNRIKALQSGIDLFLNKPFDSEELLLLISNLLKNRSEQQIKNQASQHVTDRDPFIEELNAIITRNINDDMLSVETLENWSQMSKNQLYRKVKAVSGMSTIQYINHVKLIHAASLLKTTELSVSEVAYSSGFKDPNYFTRKFSKQYKLAPLAYRDKPETETA